MSFRRLTLQNVLLPDKDPPILHVKVNFIYRRRRHSAREHGYIMCSGVNFVRFEKKEGHLSGQTEDATGLSCVQDGRRFGV